MDIEELDAEVTDFSKLLSTSTITVLVGPTKYAFHVHKSVVCTLSFFRACLDPRSGFIESTTNTISLPEDDTYAVSVLMTYLYTNKYSPIPAHNLSAEKIKIRHAKVYLIADKYDCPGLKEQALAATNAYQPADMLAILLYWEYVYRHSDENCLLRIPHRNLIAEHFVTVCYNDHLLEFRRILAENPDLAFDLLVLAVKLPTTTPTTASVKGHD